MTCIPWRVGFDSHEEAPAMRVAIIEDDASLAQVLRQGLGEEGFDAELFPDGAAGLAAGRSGRFDLLLLDVMLPALDGLSVCRRLRAEGVTTPVVMLTVKDEVADRVAGLDAGADDYLSKPFSFDELVARVRAQLRRNRDYGARLRVGDDLELDLAARCALRAGRVVELTGKEFELLRYLAAHAGEVLCEKAIIEEVWQLDFDPGTNVVNVYIHRLRRKLDHGHPRPIIHTVRGQGFRLGEPPR